MPKPVSESASTLWKLLAADFVNEPFSFHVLNFVLESLRNVSVSRSASLLVTSASLVETGALLVVTKSY